MPGAEAPPQFVWLSSEEIAWIAEVIVKDKWRKQYHEEEMAMLNNAAGAAHTEILPPGTHSLEEGSEEDEARRQAFPMHTLPPDASVESSRSS